MRSYILVWDLPEMIKDPESNESASRSLPERSCIETNYLNIDLPSFYQLKWNDF